MVCKRILLAHLLAVMRFGVFGLFMPQGPVFRTITGGPSNFSILVRYHAEIRSFIIALAYYLTFFLKNPKKIRISSYLIIIFYTIRLYNNFYIRLGLFLEIKFQKKRIRVKSDTLYYTYYKNFQVPELWRRSITGPLVGWLRNLGYRRSVMHVLAVKLTISLFDCHYIFIQVTLSGREICPL